MSSLPPVRTRSSLLFTTLRVSAYHPRLPVPGRPSALRHRVAGLRANQTFSKRFSSSSVSRPASHSSYPSLPSAPPTQPPSQASLFWATLTSAALVLLGGFAVQRVYDDPSADTDLVEDPVFSPSQHQAHLKMSTEIPPGHLGNLTPEQEQRLQQLWGMLFKIFTESPKDGQFGLQKSPTSTSVTSNGTAEKPKKKSRWWGGGSSSSKNETQTAGGEVNAFNGLDGEDKWGMNKEFINALQKHTPKELEQAFYSSCKNEHADVTVLRFLRARKWDVNKAFVMLVSTLRFRLDMYKVDGSIMARGEEGAVQDSKSSDSKAKKTGTDFLSMLNMGHSFIHGTDKLNRPICYIRVRMHKIGAFAHESVEHYTIWMIETARLMMRAPVETAAIVFDMSGFGLSNMDYTAVKFIIQCFEANYPESLGIVLVHNAPWIFSSAWSLIKGWLDPVVASKIRFTKSSEELLDVIPSSTLPKDLGGTDESEYKYTPFVEGENDAMKDTAAASALKETRQQLCETFEQRTVDWIEAAKKDKDKAKEINKERDVLAQQIMRSYWDLDPYIRARSVYDRLGLINRKGHAGEDVAPFVPANTNGTTASTPDPIAEKAATNGVSVSTNGDASVETA